VFYPIISSIFLVFSQFVGDGDDYDSVEYGDDDTQDGTLLGRISGQGQSNRVGGRRRMINNMAVRNFAAFEGYGCWCVEKKGYGPVRDEIDFACMTHSKCWGCAKATNGDECDGLVTAYRWKFIKDKATNSAIDIKCGNFFITINISGVEISNSVSKKSFFFSKKWKFRVRFLEGSKLLYKI